MGHVQRKCRATPRMNNTVQYNIVVFVSKTRMLFGWTDKYILYISSDWLLAITFDITISVGRYEVFQTCTKNTNTHISWYIFWKSSPSSLDVVIDLRFVLLFCFFRENIIHLNHFPLFSIFQKLPRNKICITGGHKTSLPVQGAKPISPWNEKALLKRFAVSEQTFYFPLAEE